MERDVVLRRPAAVQPEQQPALNGDRAHDEDRKHEAAIREEWMQEPGRHLR